MCVGVEIQAQLSAIPEDQKKHAKFGQIGVNIWITVVFNYNSVLYSVFLPKSRTEYFLPALLGRHQHRNYAPSNLFTELASLRVYLFPKLKRLITAWRFATIEETKTASLKEL